VGLEGTVLLAVGSGTAVGAGVVAAVVGAIGVARVGLTVMVLVHKDTGISGSRGFRIAHLEVVGTDAANITGLANSAVGLEWAVLLAVTPWAAVGAVVVAAEVSPICIAGICVSVVSLIAIDSLLFLCHSEDKETSSNKEREGSFHV